MSLAAWFLAMPVTNAVEAGSSWLKVLQGICVGTFVVGLEGLVFGLIPLNFMDGGTLFRWNKWVWAGVFGIAMFLFWHVLLNKNSKYGAAFAADQRQGGGRLCSSSGRWSPWAPMCTSGNHGGRRLLSRLGRLSRWRSPWNRVPPSAVRLLQLYVDVLVRCSQKARE